MLRHHTALAALSFLFALAASSCSSSDDGSPPDSPTQGAGQGGSAGSSAATGGHGGSTAGHSGSGGKSGGGQGGSHAGAAGAGTGGKAGAAGTAGSAGHGAAGKSGATGGAAGAVGVGGNNPAGGNAGDTGTGGTGTGGTGAGGEPGTGGASAGGEPGMGGAGGDMGTGGANGGEAGTGQAGGPAGGSNDGPSSTRQTPKPLGSTAAKNGYLEYLPPTYGDGQSYPLIVFWHGVGEDGNGTTDLSLVTAHGPPMLISQDKWPNDRTFVVLSPQNASNCPSSSSIHDFLAFATSTYSIDPKRVYLTGLSCGAIGSWQYINDNHAAVIAAAVLMSGDPGDPTQSGSAWGHSGCALGEAAIWGFHGDQDTTVDIGNEQATMNDLIACPSPPRRDAKFNVIAGGGHVIWDPIYDGSAGFDLYGWMLQNAKP